MQSVQAGGPVDLHALGFRGFGLGTRGIHLKGDIGVQKGCMGYVGK